MFGLPILRKSVKLKTSIVKSFYKLRVSLKSVNHRDGLLTSLSRFWHMNCLIIFQHSIMEGMAR